MMLMAFLRTWPMSSRYALGVSPFPNVTLTWLEQRRETRIAVKWTKMTEKVAL